ncbi:hypothetical protein JJQ67_24700 [Enterobacter hormaechei]|nr:hypothetical protein [Enterobacter hormaechei]
MPTAQTIIKDYRRKSVTVTVTVTLVTPVRAPGLSVIPLLNIMQFRFPAFTQHTSRYLDKLLFS